MKLTLDNYFTEENTAISNSKVSDFLKSKEYFYRKHITHEIKTEVTAPMKIGTIMDCFLSGLTVPYRTKVLKRDDPELFEEQKTMPDSKFCTDTQFTEGLERAQAVMREPCYKWYKDNGAKFQVILEGTLDDSIPLCGIADVITETSDAVYIDDFKSSSSAKLRTPKHWHWYCLEMGYYRQLALYTYLYRQMHKDLSKPIICRHVVVEKVQDECYKVHLFILNKMHLKLAFDEFKDTVRAIVKEETFEDEPVTWDKAIEPSGLDDDLTGKEIWLTEDEDLSDLEDDITYLYDGDD